MTKVRNSKTKKSHPCAACTLAVLLLVLVSSLALMLSGCGMATGTLEDYMEENTEVAQSFQKELDKAFGKEGATDITYSGDAITLTITMDEELTADEAAIMGKSFDSAADNMDEVLSDVISDLEAETGISGITMELVIKDAAETGIWTHSCE